MTSRSTAREALQGLVSRVRSGSYSARTTELNIRGNLIEPLFRDVLAWNVEDISQYDRERHSRGSGIADAVCLRDGEPVLYVEAKRLRGRVRRVRWVVACRSLDVACHDLSVGVD